MRNSSERVLALTLGNDQFASSRVRAGAALLAMQRGGRRTVRITASSRAWPLQLVVGLIVFRPAVTIIQKVAPPSWFSQVVRLLSRRMVFECDDAIQLGYPIKPSDAPAMSRKLRALIRLCDRVIVSNSLLGDDFINLGARDVVVFPGPAPSVAPAQHGTRHGVVWLGSPSTIENVREIVYPALKLMDPKVELTVIGSEGFVYADRIAELPWTSDLQATALACARVGVAPQVQDMWSLRKAFYKVLEYLAASIVPVVPAQPAVYTLLGDELEIVAVVATDDTPISWAAAISHALDVQIDSVWLAARDRVFSRWSADRLGDVMVGW